MSEVAIKVENLGKKYRLGSVHAMDMRNAFGNFISKLKLIPNHHLPAGQAGITKSPNHQIKEFWALKDINFEIRKGEAVGIIGRNGAGKSTLLKLLSRITEPTTGKFWIDGRVSSLLEVGTGFHMELTGRENIYLNGTILGMKRREIREKFDEIIDFSGVEKFIDTPVKHYSSGMQVRLAFSVAAHLEPEILIIDEVLAVGDAEFQKKCLGKMEDVTGQGRTVLFVSHNMGAVKSLCTHGLLLNNGGLDLDGRVESVINEYLSETIFRGNQIRKGNGQMQLKSFEILGPNSENTVQLNTFDRLIFRLKYEVFQDIRNVTVAICFNNINNLRVTSLWSAYYNKKFELKPGNQIFEFNVPNFKLIPGLYEIILYSESDGNVIERIDNFMQIVVGTPRKFDFGQIPTIEQGIYTEEFQITSKSI